MKYFNMLFQILTSLSCFMTSCPHEKDWYVFPKCLFLKTLTHKLGTYMTYLLHKQIQDVSKILFFRLSLITNGAPLQLFLQMNWFNILFQIDIFRKIIFTTLACFVISCPHENNWHVFPKCLFQKNLNHKLSTYMTYLFNELIQDGL